jgi:Fe-S oxidoreductase
LKKARKIINYNIEKLFPLVEESIPLIGIEPSCILSFRDEYPELVSPSLKKEAAALASQTYLIEEFINLEFAAGNITADKFVTAPQKIKFHAHCQQKAIVSSEPTRKMLSIPVNYEVSEIKSGCCGMAGSFGYEKEHYDLSMKVGELVLFPEVRKAEDGEIISAPGTSCRHHIFEGTGHKAIHPLEVLYKALV